MDGAILVVPHLPIFEKNSFAKTLYPVVVAMIESDSENNGKGRGRSNRDG